MSENDVAAMTLQVAPMALDANGTNAIRVLYVEDNRLNALLFEEALRDHPLLLLDVAEDAEDAVQVAHKKRPSVLVIDAHLPSMSGYELLPLLRGIPGLEQVPAYMCSADSSPKDHAKALSAGFDGYWCKPIDIGEITTTLCRLARQKN